MTNVHALPTPIVPQVWEKVDTSIDTETPQLLSDEQFDRYTETVIALLEAAGLTVRDNPDDPSSLSVTNPRTGFTVQLEMREDRSAEWALEAEDEIPENTPALSLATEITDILSTRTSDDG